MRVAWLWIVAFSQVAAAATVRGTITLPAEARSADAREGHWRVENGVLPIAPRVPDPRTGVIVVLESANAPKKEPDKSTVTIDLRGLRLDPQVLAVPIGATVSFKNADRVPHMLYFEGGSSLLPPEATPSGQSRAVRVLAAGEWIVRDQEYPHIEGAIVVSPSPWFTTVDDRGAFKIDAPEGKYTLRVFWRGQWVMTQPLEVGPRSTDVSLQLPAPSARPRTEKE
jgi:hypothetical protein